jgi:hypothetical protein
MLVGVGFLQKIYLYRIPMFCRSLAAKDLHFNIELRQGCEQIRLPTEPRSDASACLGIHHVPWSR